MRTWRWILVATVCGACGGEAPPAEEAKVPTTGPASPKPADAGPAAVDGSSLRALVDRIDGILGRCTPAVFAEAKTADDAARIEASCGALVPEVDAAIAAEIGKSVEGDAFIANLARGAEDMLQLQRALRTPEFDGELQTQIDHLAGSVEALKGNVAKIRGQSVLHPVDAGPMACVASAKGAEVVPKLVDGQRGRLENLGRLLTAYGILQANKPELVRTRPLVAGQKSARLRLDAERRRWDAACVKDPEAEPLVARARGALTDADAVLAAYDAAVTPLVKGEVHDAATGEKLLADFNAALEGWRAKWAPGTTPSAPAAVPQKTAVEGGGSPTPAPDGPPSPIPPNEPGVGN